MEPKIDITFFFACIGIGVGLFFGFFLVINAFTKKGTTSGFLLGTIFLMLTFEIIHDTLVRSRLVFDFLFFHGLGGLFKTALYPTIILFFLSVKKKKKFIPYLLPLYIPFIINSYYWIPSYLTISKGEKIRLLESYYKFEDTLFSGLSWQHWILYIFYPLLVLIIGLWLLRKRPNKIKFKYSMTTQLLLIFFIVSIGIKGATASQIGKFQLDSWSWLIEILLFASCIITISYFLLYDFSKNTVPSILDKVKYRNSKLTNAKAEFILGRATEILESEKLYRKKKLKLQDLAQRIDVNSNYLSQALNQVSGQSFIDFVNIHRVNEAKVLLLQDEGIKYTIEAIANEVGFKSKSAFYRAFKKQTQLNPKDFQKNKRLRLH